MESLLVGFGTLLLQASVGVTIGQRSAIEKKFRPVRVPGHRRLFNLRPTHYESSAKLTNSGIENGAMNVEPAPGLHFNALAFSVSGQELEALDKRERYYERVPVPLLDFASGAAIQGGQCYMSRPDAPWIERDPELLLPLWRDVVWARIGAARISAAFAADFDATTFLADGVTLVTEHYARVLDDIADVELPE